MTMLARLDRLPLCRPHYVLLVMGGLGYTFDGMDAAIVAFLLPSAQKEWGLSSGQLGIRVGDAVWVPLRRRDCRDPWGPDRAAGGDDVCAALLLRVHDPRCRSAQLRDFVAARVLAGLGTGAESAIIAPFLAEFVPASRRGWFLGALAGFFSFGFVGAALIGRFVVPTSDQGWRWAQVITALPVLLLLWWRRSLPESPRYLLLRGRTQEAEQVVADFERRAELATGSPLPPLPASAAEDAGRVTEAEEGRKSPPLSGALRFLWSHEMARRTAVVWTLWFVITFSYYGFFSWIPTLLIERGITVTRSFEFSIIIYAAQIPGYFSAAWCNERLDRRRTIAIYLVGSAISAFVLSQVATSAAIVAAGAVLSFFLNGVYAGLYAYTPEVFPTWVRATGTGLSSAFGRIGSITAPAIIGFFAAALGFGGVFTMTTVVLAVGVVVVLVFGLHTAGRGLEELTETEQLRALADEVTHHQGRG